MPPPASPPANQSSQSTSQPPKSLHWSGTVTLSSIYIWRLLASPGDTRARQEWLGELDGDAGKERGAGEEEEGRAVEEGGVREEVKE